MHHSCNIFRYPKDTCLYFEEYYNAIQYYEIIDTGAQQDELHVNIMMMMIEQILMQYCQTNDIGIHSEL